MFALLAASAAVLLAVAGLAKMRRPEPAVAMLISSRRALRGHRTALVPVVRLAGAVEVGIGAAVVLLGGRVPAGLLCVAYLVLTAVALRLARAPSPTSCGCFGSADGPVGIVHVVVDVGCAVAAGVGTVVPAGRLAGLTDLGAGTAIVGAVQVLLLAWLAYLAITALPALATERRRLETP